MSLEIPRSPAASSSPEFASQFRLDQLAMQAAELQASLEADAVYPQCYTDALQGTLTPLDWTGRPAGMQTQLRREQTDDPAQFGDWQIIRRQWSRPDRGDFRDRLLEVFTLRAGESVMRYMSRSRRTTLGVIDHAVLPRVYDLGPMTNGLCQTLSQSLTVLHESRLPAGTRPLPRARIGYAIGTLLGRPHFRPATGSSNVLHLS